MKIGLALLAVFAFVAGLTALLYYMGFMTLNNKTAKLFLMNGTYDYSMRHGKVKSCNGSVKRVLRFKSDEPLIIKLDLELIYGSLTVNIKDFSGETSVTVGSGCATEAELVPVVGKAYYLTFDYKNADGEFWFSIKKNSYAPGEAEEFSDSESAV